MIFVLDCELDTFYHCASLEEAFYLKSILERKKPGVVYCIVKEVEESECEE